MGGLLLAFCIQGCGLDPGKSVDSHDAENRQRPCRIFSKRWVTWLVCRWPSALRLRVRPRPNSVDFHDSENRQRPCRMIIQHVKDP
ncbi:hypothetical protein TNCV_1013631 [Trichonephila clavipes]|uniref:Uncharacterized protein n=1 Tax=Trichonephila clavipes TaxID=2585209 RepID=A0A8X6VXL1_TRICX|nr:hypothetical protein TNCV_1013631 [Trichonephila clavipes]